MKNNIFKKLSFVACAALMLHACDIDEYNPGAGETGNDPLTGYTYWSGMQTYCYEPLQGQLYTVADYWVLAECGTDLWLTAYNRDYADELMYYEGLATNTNYSNKVFKQAYAMINTCNAVINAASSVTDGDAATIKVLEGETRCLRAFYYSILVTHYGNVTLSLENSQDGVDLSPTRATYEELYEQMIEDLTLAVEYLGKQPYNNDYARCTKKTALGLLARVYAQGAGEGLYENGVSYWQRAKEVAEDLINNASTYGAALYDDVYDMWASDNNKDNDEALFLAAGPNVDQTFATNWYYSNIFTYVWPNPYKLSDIYTTADKSNYMYGRVNNNTYAPSKYLLDLFDADYDKRWESSFCCAFGDYTWLQAGWGDNFESKSVQITQELCDKYGMGTDYIGQYITPYGDVPWTSTTCGQAQFNASIWPKDATVDSHDVSTLYDPENVYIIDYPLGTDDHRFSIYLSKDYLSSAEKEKYICATINIDDLFDSEGKYNSSQFDGTDSYQLYPGFVKLNWNFYGAMYSSNLQRKLGDTFIMRMAEVYLIAAEGEVMTGNNSAAATYINALRKRAARDTAPSSFYSLSTVTEQDVLDEYARELCGEFNRWAVLKRHAAFEDQLAKGNKRAAASFTSKNYLRPISYDFLSQINNADEYGTNGY